MRDLRTRLTRSKRSRRISLAMMVVAASPLIAGEPIGPVLRLMPPLPLRPIDDSGPVRSNPFSEDTFQLVSGDESVRLKPVQGQVGLHAISTQPFLSPDTDPPSEVDSHPVQHGLHTAPPALTIEPDHPRKVKSNPPGKSGHLENEDLVETGVIDQADESLPIVATVEDFPQENAAPQTDSSTTTLPETSEQPTVHITKPRASSIVLIAPVESNAFEANGAPANLDQAGPQSTTVPASSTPSSQVPDTRTPEARIVEPSPTIRRTLPLPEPIRLSDQGGENESVVESPSDQPISFSLSDLPQDESTSLTDPPIEAESDEKSEREEPIIMSISQQGLDRAPSRATMFHLDDEPESTQIHLSDSEPDQATVSEDGGWLPVLRDDTNSETQPTVADATADEVVNGMDEAMPEIAAPTPTLARGAKFMSISDSPTHGTSDEESDAAEIASDRLVDVGGPADAAAAEPDQEEVSPPEPERSPNPKLLQPLVLDSDQPPAEDLAESGISAIELARPVAAPSRRVPTSSAIASLPAQEPTQLDEPEPMPVDRPAALSELLHQSKDRALGTWKNDQAIDPQVAADRPVERSLHSQRFRPPVAVTSVPTTYHRGEVGTEMKKAGMNMTGTVASKPSTQVQPVAEMNLASQTKSAGQSKHKLTPLYMKSAQVKSLTVGGELRDVRVADPDVCRAVASGPNQVKLIGTGNGVTQLVVWAQTDEPNRPIRMRAFQVHVDQVDRGGATPELLDQSIRSAFPQCRVVLSEESGELIVSGQCDSDESAEKIIRMIRKTCLVPVQDRLTVR